MTAQKKTACELGSDEAVYQKHYAANHSIERPRAVLHWIWGAR